MAQITVHFRIKALPLYHPAGADIYLAGSFNGWNPQDESYKFFHAADSSYVLTITVESGKTYPYKITRGSWDKVECQVNGKEAPNRVWKPGSKGTVELAVEEWADRFPAKRKQKTASRNVSIVDTAFLIPQLKRTRRIWIYLPENYFSGNQRFPVIYMQDGQNLFDEAAAFSGEWGVDDFLDSLKSPLKQCIVVGIDNGGVRRMNEYCPYEFNLDGIATGHPHNKGEGKEYVRFIVRNLKPFIDKNYRTLKEKTHTAIAGSSMGGLISLYALLKYPRVFGGAGVFSPSLWIAPKIYHEIKKHGPRVKSRIYFYAGKKEGK